MMVAEARSIRPVPLGRRYRRATAEVQADESARSPVGRRERAELVGGGRAMRPTRHRRSSGRLRVARHIAIVNLPSIIPASWKKRIIGSDMNCRLVP
jgi:hypothetical protein